ncbi:hypothetical protein RHSIM_Rhsim09G0170600 [Rhododendron simsii]|uniref:Uncharacterized protein n=1 Tax=Rhododendron simsii TaxID=118357 RepID=A0A834GD47_RHOSS|nr:hypothetical protein RHSIM_Rhsim09G0170600 [Rhododendron simsii]
MVGDDLDVPIANVPGLEGLLRRRDLSSFLRVGDLSDKKAQFIINGAAHAHRARMILNTFEELEGPTLAQMHSQCAGFIAGYVQTVPNELKMSHVSANCECVHGRRRSGSPHKKRSGSQKVCSDIATSQIFYVLDDLSDKIFKRIVNVVTQAHRARAMMLHTFEELEGPAIFQIRSQCPNVYAIGPLPEHLKTRLTSVIPSKCVNKQDASCIASLDAQPLKFVIYIGFGSIEVKPHNELMELWHGLKNSGKQFLWAIPKVTKKE